MEGDSVNVEAFMREGYIRKRCEAEKEVFASETNNMWAIES
jgi:hypothetical protein